MVKLVARLIDFLPVFVRGVSFVCLIRFATCFLWESLLFVLFVLLLVCYRKVVCSFDEVWCRCLMGKSIAHLIRFADCALWQNRLFI